jgi:uncharacterized membrane protein YfcA
MTFPLVLLGLFGGALTTVAGMGGGLFLVLSLSALLGPGPALAITAPALLVSNLHRAYIFRAHVERSVVLKFALGTVPAAVVGGMVASRLPTIAVQLAMLGLTSFAVLRSLGVVRFAPSARAFVPMSAGVGVLSASAGAGGFLAGPLLMSVGLTGARYISTVALCSVVLHAARIVGYQAGGLFKAAHLGASALLLAGLVAGNMSGKRLRGRFSPAVESRIELGALIVCTLLGLVGIGTR